MLSEALVTYVHYLGFMVLFAALVAQHLLFVTAASPQQVRRLFTLDGIYGAAAIVVLVTGLSKVFLVGKPAIFYAQNGFFHAKVTLFVVLALLSIWPTVQFYKANKMAASLPASAVITLPGKIRTIQRIELVTVMFLPLLAALISRA
jgi:putative membrane protein